MNEKRIVFAAANLGGIVAWIVKRTDIPVSFPVWLTLGVLMLVVINSAVAMGFFLRRRRERRRSLSRPS